MLASLVLGRKLLGWLESLLARLPLVQTDWTMEEAMSFVMRRRQCAGSITRPGGCRATATAAATLAAGIFADSQWSPLYWAQLIAHREYLLPLGLVR